MTEEEWLASPDPTPMLAFLQGKASDRKLRLFACACCRRIWHLIPHRAYRNLVELAEGFADGQVGWEQLREAELAAYDQAGTQGHNEALWAASNTIGDICAIPYTGDEASWLRAAMAAAKPLLPAEATAPLGVGDDYSWWHAAVATAATEGAMRSGPAGTAYRSEQQAQARLVRDLFGNPFHPVVMDPTWRTSKSGCVTKLAGAIYDEGRFADLPVLADALEEAGCDNTDILAHCRQSGEHTRGCWVVDAILSKT